MTFEEACDEVLDARSPVDLFGEDATRHQIVLAYRRLAKALHPDRNQKKDGVAHDAFTRLGLLYNEALQLFALRKYDTSAEYGVVVGKYRVSKDPIFQGASSNIYPGIHESGDSVLFKMNRHPSEGRHIKREGDFLRALYTDGVISKERAFFPRLRESMTIRANGAGDPGRQTTLVFDRPHDLYDLRYVRDQYPWGVHPKDVAWMLRRLFFALGAVHGAGVVHGAVFPEHVLIEPDLHGLVLIDWKHAVPIGKRIRYVPRGRMDDYPPELMDRKAVGPSLDIWLAAHVGLYLLGDYGGPIETFLRGCLYEDPNLRPSDAWRLRSEFDDLLERMWGPRRFHEFQLRRRSRQ